MGSNASTRGAPCLQTPDIEILGPFVAKFLKCATEGRSLTPSEIREVLHIAQGFTCKDSAAADKLSHETVRARRKRIYRKLKIEGADELTSTLLAESLQMLASGEGFEPSRMVPPRQGDQIGTPEGPAAAPP